MQRKQVNEPGDGESDTASTNQSQTSESMSIPMHGERKSSASDMTMEEIVSENQTSSNANLSSLEEMVRSQVDGEIIAGQSRELHPFDNIQFIDCEYETIFDSKLRFFRDEEKKLFRNRYLTFRLKVYKGEGDAKEYNIFESQQINLTHYLKTHCCGEDRAVPAEEKEEELEYEESSHGSGEPGTLE